MLEENIHWIKELIKRVDYLITLLGFPGYEPIPYEIEEKIYSQQEAAAELSVRDRTIRRYVVDGRLKESRNFRGPYYKQSDLDECRNSIMERRRKKS